MKAIIQILKFLCYAAIAVVEFTLKMLLDVILQMKKPFQ